MPFRIKKLDKDAFIEISLCGRNPTLIQSGRQFLNENGYSSNYVACFLQKRKFRLSVYIASTHQAAVLEKQYNRFKVPGLHLRRKLLLPKGWKDKWKTSYHPIPLLAGFVIVPIWRKAEIKPRQIPVYPPPQKTPAVKPGMNAPGLLLRGFRRTHAILLRGRIPRA